MKKAILKTAQTKANVSDFIASISKQQQRKDSKILTSLMQKITKAKPKLWGSAIVGFGEQHLMYPSGRELDWFIMGFSPRKSALSVYVHGELEKYKDQILALGQVKTGKGCIYIKTLEDIHIPTLEKLLRKSMANHSK
jgi:hypothetical protein